MLFFRFFERMIKKLHDVNINYNDEQLADLVLKKANIGTNREEMILANIDRGVSGRD